MKKLLIFSIFLFLYSIGNSLACSDKDSRFKLIITLPPLHDVNYEELKRQCSTDKGKEVCVIGPNSVTLKSSYDKRIELVMACEKPVFPPDAKYDRFRDQMKDTMMCKEITIKLPYKIDSKGYPSVSEIDPKTFNWKECVKTDLAFLNQAGILMLPFNFESKTIDTISGLATGGVALRTCYKGWDVFQPNCNNCEGNCVKCA